MKRIYFALLGVAALVSVGGIIITFGTGGELALFMLVSLLIAADLFIIGGIRESIPVGSMEFKWYQLIGAGIVMVGLGIGASSLQEIIGSNALSARVFLGAVTMLIFFFIGIDFLRGGVHHDLSTVE